MLRVPLGFRSLAELRVGYPAILTLCVLGGLLPGQGYIQEPGNPIGIHVGQNLVLFAFLNSRVHPRCGKCVIGMLLSAGLRL